MIPYESEEIIQVFWCPSFLMLNYSIEQLFVGQADWQVHTAYVSDLSDVVSGDLTCISHIFFCSASNRNAIVGATLSRLTYFFTENTSLLTMSKPQGSDWEHVRVSGEIYVILFVGSNIFTP